ncbi:MAG TPA: tRNA uridine-5-carboxymethylaminomethyl(34) synthesis GTPase MnmE [Chitinophagales bacterium]|nr:tRNA uridine-5-carboxymethylaminomethyl(34) synthesis GTPase MnmE [Chitinophagales bacterium]
MNQANNKDTIVAISTPNGVGAIGVIRLSGEDAVKIVNTIFSGKNILEQASHTIHLGKIIHKHEILDEVLVSLFLAPSSYTKENVVEISCHGSPYILQKIITALIDNGARPAKPGEFTQRAFLNGRFDLSQAEAVADIIASDSQAAHKIAMQQMRGGISSKLKELRTSLIDFAALIELELDFGEEDVEFADRKQLNNLLHQIQLEIEVLLQSFQFGNAIKNGIPVAIIGKPNAGKSTLLNALLNEERAIVSAIAGTTRDTIEEILTIDGYLFRFIDTAGLREAKDEIEKIGIERSKETIDKADIVIYLFDISSEDFAVVEEELKIIPKNKKVIILGNKQDLNKSILDVSEPVFSDNFIAISAKEKVGIDELKTALIKLLLKDKIDQNAVIITNQRHYEALQKSQNAIDEVIQKLQQNISSDFISQDIKTALRHLGQITGVIDIDKDILATIFGKFCIGK